MHLPTRVQLCTQPLSPMRLKVVKNLMYSKQVAHGRKLLLLLYPATPGVDANAHTDYNVLYTVQRMCTTARNQRMMDIHETGITKLSRGDKLITARKLVYLPGDIDGVQSNDASIAQRRATRRYARRRSAPRRAAIRRERALRDCPADPPSGDELAI